MNRSTETHPKRRALVARGLRQRRTVKRLVRIGTPEACQQLGALLERMILADTQAQLDSMSSRSSGGVARAERFAERKEELRKFVGRYATGELTNVEIAETFVAYSDEGESLSLQQVIKDVGPLRREIRGW